jgi:hypothetical protein
MGVIRKTASLFTLGIIRPSSKKQRVAKKTLQAQRRTANATERLASHYEHDSNLRGRPHE